MKQHANGTAYSKKTSPILASLTTGIILLLITLLAQQCGVFKPRGGNDVNTSCTSPRNYTGQPPLNGISLQTALEMADMFDSTQYRAYNNNGSVIPDAQSVWFSLDTLEKFIWSIKSVICAKTVTQPPKLGIRIYFATYPEDMGRKGRDTSAINPDYAQVNPDYSKLHTVFIAPTFEADDSNHYDFDPADPNYNAGGKPFPLARYFLKQDDMGEWVRKEISEITGVNLGKKGLLLLPNSTLNHGSLFPPKKRSGEAF